MIEEFKLRPLPPTPEYMSATSRAQTCILPNTLEDLLSYGDFKGAEASIPDEWLSKGRRLWDAVARICYWRATEDRRPITGAMVAQEMKILSLRTRRVEALESGQPLHRMIEAIRTYETLIGANGDGQVPPTAFQRHQFVEDVVRNCVLSIPLPKYQD